MFPQLEINNVIYTRVSEIDPVHVKQILAAEGIVRFVLPDQRQVFVRTHEFHFPRHGKRKVLAVFCTGPTDLSRTDISLYGEGETSYYPSCHTEEAFQDFIARIGSLKPYEYPTPRTREYRYFSKESAAFYDEE